VWLAAALHGLGDPDIVGDDEAREVGIVQAIVAGDWWLPRFNGEILPDKRSSDTWLAAVPVVVNGFSEAAWAPSALAAALTVAWTAGSAAAGPKGLLRPPFSPRCRVLRARPPRAPGRASSPPPFLASASPSPGGATAAGARSRGARRARRADARKGPWRPCSSPRLRRFLVWQRDVRCLVASSIRRHEHVPRPRSSGGTRLALAGWGDLFVREHLVGRYVFNLVGDLPEGGAYSERPYRMAARFYVLHLPLIGLPGRRSRRCAVDGVGATIASAIPASASSSAGSRPRRRLHAGAVQAPLLSPPGACGGGAARGAGGDPTLARGHRRAPRPRGARGGLRRRRARRCGADARWQHDALARSDRSTIEALAPAVPGGVAGLVPAVALAVGFSPSPSPRVPGVRSSSR
jgi:hypothetical protein